MPDRLRFAPSPNGPLHLGHAYSALFTAEAANQLGGAFLLRIEDIDVGRCRPEYEQAIYDDLAWLGLAWERPVRRQSEHFSDYQAALNKLRDQDLVYPCFATRKEITDAIASRTTDPKAWPRDPDGAPLYPGLYKHISPGERNRLMWEGRSFAWRLDMEKAASRALEVNKGPISFLEEGEGPETLAGPRPGPHQGRLSIHPELFGDVIIARKDVPTSYHLAVTVDDALQNITCITRGQDLFPATYIHRLLQILLDLPEPRYRHHRLICDDTGRRLSKSDLDKGLHELRAGGASPADIRRMVGL